MLHLNDCSASIVWINTCLLCICICVTPTSDARRCDPCHRSAGDDRIGAEVREHRDVPLDGTVRIGFAPMSVLLRSWGLSPTFSRLWKVFQCFLHSCSKLWVMCEKWSPYGWPEGSCYRRPGPWSSYRTQPLCKHSLQVLCIFCVISSTQLCTLLNWFLFRESSVVSSWCLDSAHRLTCLAVVTQPGQPR